MAETQFQWTQDTWESAGATDEQLASKRRDRLAWLGVIVVAVVAFEITADPALTVLLGCLKSGWDEFRLAHWLERTDPDRRRGKVCSRFYLAWGLCRIILVAFAVMFLIVIVQSGFEGKFQKGAGPIAPPRSFMSAVVVAMTCFLLLAGLSALALVSSLWYRVRVWVGPEAHWARAEKLWPPHTVRRRRQSTNWARVIILSGMITMLGIGSLILVIVVALVTSGRMVSEKIVVGSILVILLGGLVSIFSLMEILGPRMIAETPEACWADPPEVLIQGR